MMAKSRKGRGGEIPTAPMAAGRTPTLTDLTARKPASLEAILANAPAKAREAERCVAEAIRLMRQGRPAEAAAQFQQAIQFNPNVPTSHHDLGVALMSAGRLEAALQAFAAAARVKPDFASAHHNLGHLHDTLGHEAQAIASYRTAARLKPDLVPVQLRLGQLYRLRGLGAESAAAYRAAAAAAGPALARTAEALALEALGDFDEALAHIRAAVTAHPENAGAHATLAHWLAQAGRSAEAATHYQRAAELSPAMVDAWSGLTTNKKFIQEDAPLIARMDVALARPELLPRHRLSLNFALGKAHDDIGEYETAMRHFEAGNRLRAQSCRFDRAAFVRRVDRLIEATPPGYRDRQSDRGVEDATPILIVGMPRSGSTLVEQILSSHPDVAAGDELPFWHLRDKPDEDLFQLAATPEATQRLADEYLTTLRAFGPHAKRVTDKALGNFVFVGLIHRVFPNATFLHCRRHPIDTALSIFTTNFGSRFDFAASRGDIVFYFRQYERLMAHWREALPPDRLIDVDYEALVANPEPQVRRLVAACGLDWNEICLAPQLNTRRIATASLWQARQPIYRSSTERWRRYEPWLGELGELAPEG